jgi:single-strand DNA-binding protein
MTYELTGTVKLISAPQTFSSGFAKRELVVTVEDGKYPQDISVEFVQDKMRLLDDLQVGQTVTVAFNLRGREYQGRYFNNLQGWKITILGAQEPAMPGEESPPFPDVPF